MSGGQAKIKRIELVLTKEAKEEEKQEVTSSKGEDQLQREKFKYRKSTDL